jgi:hypothetical protein
MLGKLRIAAVLAFLLPSLAHGADPSANLSVQVVPPGSVPNEAANAGFTTLAQAPWAETDQPRSGQVQSTAGRLPRQPGRAERRLKSTTQRSYDHIGMADSWSTRSSAGAVTMVGAMGRELSFSAR